MGTSHALTGAAVGVVSLAVAPVHGPGVAAWVGTVVAWSVWSDWDHGRRSTAKNMWGRVSAWPAHVGGWFVGGHRGLTHRAFAVILVVVAIAAASAAVARWPFLIGAVYAITLGMFLAATDALIDGVRIPAWLNLTVSVAVAVALVAGHVVVPWLPVAAGLGIAVHLAGDRVRVGSVAERVVCLASLAAVLAYPFRVEIGVALRGVVA